MDRVFSGEPDTRATRESTAPTVEEIRKHNAQYKHFYDTDVKTSLKFSSKVAFDAWLNHLDANEKAKYAKWKVAEDSDGNVLVYKELNQEEGFQPDGDWLVAVNGARYTKSRADKRKEFTTKFNTYRSTKENPYSVWRKESKSSLSGSNIIAKIVGAVANKHQLLQGAGVKAYADLTKHIYSIFKPQLIQRFRALFPEKLKPKAGLVASTKDKDITLPKIVKSWQFKLALLASLASTDMEAVIVGVVRDGRPPQNSIRIIEQSAIVPMCADAAANAHTFIGNLSNRYKIDLRAISKEFGDEYGGMTPARPVAQPRTRPAIEFGEFSAPAPTGEGIGEGAIAEYTGDIPIFAGQF
jgi:hypothetical protein